MKIILLLITLFSLAAASAQGVAADYSTKPNTTGYPFPTAFPVRPEGKGLQFDWERYISEAVSDGDKIFRMNLAFSGGFRLQNSEILGVQSSDSDEMTRNRIAADEATKGCILLEKAYRERVKDNRALRAILEEFITHHRKAIDASIKLIGDSWEGGSGARVAFPAARLNAFIRYRAALLDLKESMDFQDMTPIPFPTPSKLSK